MPAGIQFNKQIKDTQKAAQDALAQQIARQKEAAEPPPDTMGFAGSATLQDADLYGGLADQWYQGGLGPRGELAADYRYDPQLIDTSQLGQIDYYNFDPARQEAMNQLQAQQASGYQTALTQQAAAGGLTAADRMALASSFNRGRLGAQGNLLGSLASQRAQNVYDVDKFNTDLMNRAYLQNIELENLAQQANIARLAEERDKRYGISRDLYAEARRQEGAEKLGEEIQGY